MGGVEEWARERDRREFEEHRERDARLLLTAATMRFRANDLTFEQRAYGVEPGRLVFVVNVGAIDFWATYRELEGRKGWTG